MLCTEYHYQKFQPALERGIFLTIKVLHILTRLIRGGADESTILTVAGLQKNRFETSLLIGGDSDQTYMQEVSDEINVLYEPQLRRNVNVYQDISALCRLYHTIKIGGYQIVHTNTAKAGFLGRLAAKMAGVPIIIHTIHGITFHQYRPPLERNFYLLLEKFVARFTDRLIAVGEELQEYYLSQHIGCREQYKVIHTGMDLEIFFQARTLPECTKQDVRRRFGIAQSAPVIGLVSRLDPGKGQHYLLQAIPHILTRFPTAKFLFLGEGPHRKFLENLTKELQLERHVIFAGFCQNIEKIIAIFDIAVLTSLWEGLPRVIVQYAAVGKPIVAFGIQGVSELVKDGINGFTVPVKDVKRLTKCLLYLLENPQIAQSMGIKGQQYVDNTWSSETMLHHLIEEYQYLLKKKTRNMP